MNPHSLDITTTTTTTAPDSAAAPDSGVHAACPDLDALLYAHGGQGDLDRTQAVWIDPQSGEALSVVDWDPPCDLVPSPSDSGEAVAA